MPLTLTPNGANEDGFYWNTKNIYYSNDVSKSFFISYQKSPVSINQVKFKTYYDVYPNDFSIYVSNDNESWIPIIKNQTLCDKSSSMKKHENSLGCKYNLIRTFAAEQIKGFYTHLKFEMISNTYNETSDFYNLITFYGFEMSGKLLTEYRAHTSKCSHLKNNLLCLMISTLMSK